ncbi:MAG: DNA/RNA non-specific endonuclease [Pseudohongiellaceae bacterium]
MPCIKQFLIRWVSTVFVITAGGLSVAQQTHISHCAYGCPIYTGESNASKNDTEKIVVRHLFAASIRDDGLARWIAYRVLPGTVGVASLLPRYWQLDDFIGGGATLSQEVGESNRLEQVDLSNAQDSDYRVNEVKLVASDRARLAPMTSFAGTPYWNELNYLSNMTPMPADLRTGAWARLDQAVNELAQQGVPFSVISGPIFDGTAAQKDEIGAPTNFFKIVVQGTSRASFIFPAHARPQSNYCDYLHPLSALSEASELEFFPDQFINWSDDVALSLSCTN